MTGAPVLVAGLGHELRGDDGIGLAVARALAERTPSELDAHTMPGEPVALLELWRDRDTVIVIDAMHTGRMRAGSTLRFDAHRQPLPETLRRRATTHGVGLAETIELGRVLDRLPRRLIVLAVAGRHFDTGTGLSSELQAAVPRLADAVAAEAARLQTS